MSKNDDVKVLTFKQVSLQNVFIFLILVTRNGI